MSLSGHEPTNSYRFCVYQAEWGSMEQQGIPKTYKYTLKPTLEQERLLEHTLILQRSCWGAT